MHKYVFLLFVLLTDALFAEPLHLESGVKRNTLIELYTSEGCSSCPPAEEYLNKLKNNKNLWKEIIPVAFHVDYWDYIGWKDRYATKKYGQRQSIYARLKRASTVYTPAFMVNGSSWRPGIFSNAIPADQTAVGKLAATVNDSFVRAKYQPTKKSGLPLKLNVAVLGMSLLTKIERGENEGRTAKHEFVVVGFKSIESKNLKWKVKLPELHYSQAKKYALAIWVSEIDNPTPLQAVGGNYER